MHELIYRSVAHPGINHNDILDILHTSRSFMAYQQLNSVDLDRLSEQLMIKNFITLAQLSEKPTQAVHLFWNAARQLLEEGKAN